MSMRMSVVIVVPMAAARVVIMLVLVTMVVMFGRMSLGVFMFHSGGCPAVARMSAGATVRGTMHAHSPVTSNVTIPPSTLAGTKPHPAAVNSDSNSPNSCDAPMITGAQ